MSKYETYWDWKELTASLATLLTLVWSSTNGASSFS